MDGAAIAINEQRFAANIINVVSADEFGFVAEGNVGDFLKLLPGVTIDYGGGDARHHLAQWRTLEQRPGNDRWLQPRERCLFRHLAHRRARAGFHQ